MATFHISCNLGDIAPIVIMPGDPLRAKMIAEKYLTNYKLVNSTRNMLAYTGYYKNKLITVMGSGMGIPSMGIYSYELFSHFNVDKIIRIGTCGSYKKNINVKDVVLVSKIISNSNYLNSLDVNLKIQDLNLSKDNNLLNQCLNIAKEKNLSLKQVVANCSEVFYTNIPEYWKTFATSADVVEMESLSLYANAKILNKEAICLLTVSDSFITKEAISASEREKKLISMIEIALEVK